MGTGKTSYGLRDQLTEDICLNGSMDTYQRLT